MLAPPHSNTAHSAQETAGNSKKQEFMPQPYSMYKCIKTLNHPARPTAQSTTTMAKRLKTHPCPQTLSFNCLTRHNAKGGLWLPSGVGWGRALAWALIQRDGSLNFYIMQI